jgi:xanthine dehydrogenase accessory factor
MVTAAEYSALPRHGGMRGVWQAAVLAQTIDAMSVLAIVLETEGSTYAPIGTCMLLSNRVEQSGWLSGGCLEPEIALRAEHCANTHSLDVIAIDARDDSAIFSGHATGCRGRMLIGLIPLACLDNLSPWLQRWLGGENLHITHHVDGQLSMKCAELSMVRQLPVSNFCDVISASSTLTAVTAIEMVSPERVIIFGAGPETPSLLAHCCALGWHSTLIEARPRWTQKTYAADVHLDSAPDAVEIKKMLTARSAALVMHHHFELDLRALAMLAESKTNYIGLLGPRQRREDLLKLVSVENQNTLSLRLHSPIGLKLGGHGAEAISLAIAAELHAHWHV